VPLMLVVFLPTLSTYRHSLTFMERRLQWLLRAGGSLTATDTRGNGLLFYASFRDQLRHVHGNTLQEQKKNRCSNSVQRDCASLFEFLVLNGCTGALYDPERDQSASDFSSLHDRYKRARLYEQHRKVLNNAIRSRDQQTALSFLCGLDGRLGQGSVLAKLSTDYIYDHRSVTEHVMQFLLAPSAASQTSISS
jgi:hypothetical protein